MNKKIQLKYILYLGPCFLSLSILYTWINVIYASYIGLFDRKIIISIITLSTFSICSILMLFFEYFFLIKKSRICGLILIFLCSIFVLMNSMVLFIAILGHFNIILQSPGFKTIGGYFNHFLYILLMTFYFITHYLLYKKHVKPKS